MYFTLLEAQFLQANDAFVVPLCLILLIVILRSRVNACNNKGIKNLYYQAFIFKVICVFAFTFISEFYFGGGDTALYYQGVKDIRAGLTDNANNFWVVVQSPMLDNNNPLAPYFIYDNYSGDYTFGYMRSAANFFMPRLALIPSLIFDNSYLCISLCFSFFAMGGGIRLFKTLYYYYPTLKKELAIATLFLPSVGFWSSGLMKDTICFGCVGFITYAILNIFIKRTKYASSIFWIIVCAYLLLVIKTYIFLVLLLSMTIWIFAETNKLIKDKTLRQVFAFMTFVIGIGIGFFLIRYFTAADTLKQYQFENIVSSAEYQRKNYEVIEEASNTKNTQTSYYTVNTSNPFLLVVNSIVATFFRPFPWEIKSAAAVLSAIEAFVFLMLTIHLFFSKNASRRFRLIFKDPRILMCFVFAIVFAIGVGASTANFGALSRYKIPCMPFYMLMILLLYRNTGLAYPGWFKWVIGKQKKR